MEEAYLNSVDHEIRHRNVDVADWSHEIGDAHLMNATPYPYTSTTSSLQNAPMQSRNQRKTYTRKSSNKRHNKFAEGPGPGRSTQPPPPPLPPQKPARRSNGGARQDPYRKPVGPPPRATHPPQEPDRRPNNYYGGPSGRARSQHSQRPARRPNNFYGGAGANRYVEAHGRSTQPPPPNPETKPSASSDAQRPKLNLKDIKKVLEERNERKLLENDTPIEDPAKSTQSPLKPATKLSIFGGAKPVDTYKKMVEIEEKKKKLEEEKKLEERKKQEELKNLENQKKMEEEKKKDETKDQQSENVTELLSSMTIRTRRVSC